MRYLLSHGLGEGTCVQGSVSRRPDARTDEDWIRSSVCDGARMCGEPDRWQTPSAVGGRLGGISKATLLHELLHLDGIRRQRGCLRRQVACVQTNEVRLPSAFRGVVQARRETLAALTIALMQALYFRHHLLQGTGDGG